MKKYFLTLGLILSLCSLTAFAANFSLTNNTVYPVYAALYATNSAGQAVFSPRNLVGTNSVSVLTNSAPVGVAVVGTNAGNTLARLTLLTALPATGAKLSVVLSNYSAWATWPISSANSLVLSSNSSGGNTNVPVISTNAPGGSTNSPVINTNAYNGNTNAPVIGTNTYHGGTNSAPVFIPLPVSIFAGTNANPNGLLISGFGSLYNQFDAATGTNYVQQWVKRTRSSSSGWVVIAGGGGITSVVGDITNGVSGSTLILNTNFLADAPGDGNQYARQNGAWNVVTNYVDAPSDGLIYARSNAMWVAITQPPSVVISIDSSGTMTWVASGVTATQFNVYETYDQDVNNMGSWSLVGTGNFSDGSYGGLQTNGRWYILTPIDGSSNPIQPFSNQFYSFVL